MNCKYYDIETGWCKKLTDWRYDMPIIEYCPKAPCPYYEEEDISQKIEKLQKQLDSKCDRCIAIERAKAIKEFAEMLKAKCHNYYPSIDSYCVSRKVVLLKDIDELVKEMTEKDNDTIL